MKIHTFAQGMPGASGDTFMLLPKWTVSDLFIAQFSPLISHLILLTPLYCYEQTL